MSIQIIAVIFLGTIYRLDKVSRLMLGLIASAMTTVPFTCCMHANLSQQTQQTEPMISNIWSLLNTLRT